MIRAVPFVPLFALAVGLLFASPMSPIGVVSSDLELQNPLASIAGIQLAQNPIVGEGMGGNLDAGGGVSGSQDAGGGRGVQTGGGSAGQPLSSPIKDPTIKGFLTTLLGEFIKIGYIVGVIFIVYAGFLFVTAGDNESKITKARETLFWTVIGIGILLGAQAIAIIVSSTLEALVNSAS